MPQRIQHHLLTKGWRTPPASSSSRGRADGPSGDNREEVLRAYRVHVEEKLKSDPGCLDPLRGRDLACACPLGDPAMPTSCLSWRTPPVASGRGMVRRPLTSSGELPV